VLLVAAILGPASFSQPFAPDTEEPTMKPRTPSPPAEDRVHVGAEYTPEEAEFLAALDRYKRRHRRPHPRWTEVLAVLRSLGWRKVGPEDASNGHA
jgi:hypothetical protein